MLLGLREVEGLAQRHTVNGGARPGAHQLLSTSLFPLFFSPIIWCCSQITGVVAGVTPRLNPVMLHSLSLFSLFGSQVNV